MPQAVALLPSGKSRRHPSPPVADGAQCWPQFWLTVDARDCGRQRLVARGWTRGQPSTPCSGNGQGGPLRRLREALGSQVRSIRPDDRFQLRIDHNLIKELRVPQWLNHRPPQLTTEVDRILQAIVKTQPEASLRPWLNLEDWRAAAAAYRGSIRPKPSSRCQFADPYPARIIEKSPQAPPLQRNLKSHQNCP